MSPGENFFDVFLKKPFTGLEFVVG
jgi:hypothetical protein